MNSWKNFALGTALMAESDPVAYAKANMDTLRTTHVVSKAIVSQTAKSVARMQYYGAVAIGNLDKAAGGILKHKGQQMPNAKGIMGNNTNDKIWSFSAAMRDAAIIGFAGDIEAGTTVDMTIEPYNDAGDGGLDAGNAAPHTFATRHSATEAAMAYGDVINGIANIWAIPVGAQIYIIPILFWHSIKCKDFVVTPV